MPVIIITGQRRALVVESPSAQNLVYMTAEGLVEVSDTGTSWIDVVTLSATSGDFQANESYIGFWSVDAQCSSSSSSVAARITKDGADIFTTDAVAAPKEITSPVDYHSLGGLFTYVPGASPPSVEWKIQVTRGAGAATFKGKNGRLSFLKLGPDDYYAESIARQTTAAESAQIAATLNFTPQSAGNYVILCSFFVDLVSASNVFLNFELVANVGSPDQTTGVCRHRTGADADRSPVLLILPLTGVSGSTDVTLTYWEGGIGTTTVGISEIRIVAIREDRFANVYKTVLGADNSGSDTSYTTALSQTFTPVAADHLTIAGWLMGNESVSVSSQSIYDDDGTTLNEFIREGTTILIEDAFTGGSVSHRVASYAAASRTQAIKRLSETAISTRIYANSSAIVTLDLSGLT